MKNRLYYIATLAAAAGSVFAQATGGIQGVISDDGGKSLAGAYVIATPLGIAGGLTYTAVSATGGQFSFAKVPPGNYMLCVQMPRSAHLDPCSWSSPPRVTVTAGQVSANNSVRLATGAVVHVRVNDPGQHVSKGDGEVLLGIGSPSSLFHPLGLAASDASGKTFDIAIPLNTALRLEISSDLLQLADDKGMALSAAPTGIPIQVSPGQSDPTLTFNITGKK